MRNESSWELCPPSWHGSLCCVSSCSKHYCAWWQSIWLHQSAGKLVYKFHILSGVSGAPDPCLSDLAVPDYFLWGCVKSKVYETHPAKINDLNLQIWECINRSLDNCYSMLWHRVQNDCSCVEWHDYHLVFCQLQTVMVNMNSSGHGMCLT